MAIDASSNIVSLEDLGSKEEIEDSQ